MTLAETSIGRLIFRRGEGVREKDTTNEPIQVPENRYEFRKWMDQKWKITRSEFLDGRSIDEVIGDMGTLGAGDRNRIERSYNRRMKTMEIQDFKGDLENGKTHWSDLYREYRGKGLPSMKAARAVYKEKTLSIPDILNTVENGEFDNVQGAEGQADAGVDINPEETPNIENNDSVYPGRHLENKVYFRGQDEWGLQLVDESNLDKKWADIEKAIRIRNGKKDPKPHDINIVEKMTMNWRLLSHGERAKLVVVPAVIVAVLGITSWLSSPRVVEYLTDLSLRLQGVE